MTWIKRKTYGIFPSAPHIGIGHVKCPNLSLGLVTKPKKTKGETSWE
jgi:hypothetical protein